MWPIELKTACVVPTAVSDPCLLGSEAGGEEESNGILKCVRHVNDLLCDAWLLRSFLGTQISHPNLVKVSLAGCYGLSFL